MTFSMLQPDPTYDIIRSLLVKLEIGISPGERGEKITKNNTGDSSTSSNWLVFVKNEPDTPDNVITVNSTVGRKDGRVHNTGAVVQHPGFQIKVRSSKDVIGYGKAQRIIVSLQEQVHMISVRVKLNDYIVQAISMDTAEPLDLGTERPSSKRYLFAVNGLATIHYIPLET